MQSWPRRRSPCRWRTELLAAAGLWASIGLSPGCDDRVCGPGDAPAAGVTATIDAMDGSDGVTITYGDFISSANNDCPPAEGGPTSITIDGVQSSPASDVPYHMIFCLPRPDELGAGPVSLTDERLVQLIDVRAQLADGCRLDLDRTAAAAGTIDFLGYCDGGLHPDGYALALEATVPGKRICEDGTDTTEEPVSITLSGTVAVEAL